MAEKANATHGTAWFSRNSREHQRFLEATKHQWAPTRYSRTFGPLRVEIETAGDGTWSAAIWAGEQIIETAAFRDRITAEGADLGLKEAKVWARRWMDSVAGVLTDEVGE